MLGSGWNKSWVFGSHVAAEAGWTWTSRSRYASAWQCISTQRAEQPWICTVSARRSVIRGQRPYIMRWPGRHLWHSPQRTHTPPPWCIKCLLSAAGSEDLLVSIRHSVSPHTGVTSPHTEEIKPDTALKGTDTGQLPPTPSHGKKQKK